MRLVRERGFVIRELLVTRAKSTVCSVHLFSRVYAHSGEEWFQHDLEGPLLNTPTKMVAHIYYILQSKKTKNKD